MFIIHHSTWRSHWAAVGPDQPAPQWTQVVSLATDVGGSGGVAPPPPTPTAAAAGASYAADDDVVGVSRVQDRTPADAGGHKVAPPTSAAVVVSCLCGRRPQQQLQGCTNTTKWHQQS